MTRKQIGKVAGFLLVLLASVICLTYIFINKWTSVCYESSVPTEFYKLDKNSIEVAFFGSSQVAQGISGMELYEDYGISAYTLGTARQPMLATYAWLKECYKTQKIKLAVIDTAALYYKTVPETRYRQAFDNMKLSWNKIQALLAHRSHGAKDPFFSYIFRISKYHSRWNDLDEDDFTFYLDDHMVFRGNALYSDKVTLDINALAYDNDKPSATAAMNSFEVEYMEKFIDFCEENGIELLLIKTPRTDWNITQHEQVAEFAAQHELPFLDLCSMDALEAMGIDSVNDFMDKKHLNISGAEKMSRYIGAYLKENYELTDFRDVEGFNELNYDRYCERKEDSKLQMAVDVIEYLPYLKNERYDVLLQTTADVTGLFLPEMLEVFSDLGLQGQINGLYGHTYIAQVNSGVCVYESTSEKKMKHKGYLSDGTEYKLDSSYKEEDAPELEFHFQDVDFANRGMNILVYDHQNGIVVDRSTLAYSEATGGLMLIKENPRRMLVELAGK